MLWKKRTLSGGKCEKENPLFTACSILKELNFSPVSRVMYHTTTPTTRVMYHTTTPTTRVMYHTTTRVMYHTTTRVMYHTRIIKKRIRKN